MLSRVLCAQAILSCGVGEYGVKEIARLINAGKCPMLKKIELYNNGAGAYAIAELSRAFRHSSGDKYLQY